ncbi:MAG: tetratricopeptide repeat protein [Caulobacteraceae bacterium]
MAYFKATEPDKALKAIDALLAEQPNNPYLWELKGQVLFETGRVPESEAPYRKSVELKPDAPLLQINLGQTLVSEEDPKKLDEAIAHLSKAIDLEKDNAFAWQILARALRLQGRGGHGAPGHGRAGLFAGPDARGLDLRHAGARDAAEELPRMASRHRHRPGLAARQGQRPVAHQGRQPGRRRPLTVQHPEPGEPA